MSNLLTLDEPIVVLTQTQLASIIRRTAFAVASELRDDLASNSTPELMTKTELAKYLRCDISKINRYMGNGLPVEQFGHHPRFRKISIDRWLQDEHIQTLQGQEA